MAYVRSDLPIRRRKDLECEHIETLCYELNMDKRKWGIMCSYRSPSVPDSLFERDITTCLDKMLLSFDHIVVYGDLNYDELCPAKHKLLKHIQDIFNLTNLVKFPTCYTKNSDPSLIDVIMTNSPTLFCNTSVVNCGISDCHRLILSSLKEQLPVSKNKQIIFRS